MAQDVDARSVLKTAKKCASPAAIALVQWLNAQPNDPESQEIASILDALTQKNAPQRYAPLIETKARPVVTDDGLELFFSVFGDRQNWQGLMLETIRELQANGQLSRIRRCANTACNQWVIGRKYCQCAPGKMSCSQERYARSTKGRKNARERQRNYRARHKLVKSN